MSLPRFPPAVAMTVVASLFASPGGESLRGQEPFVRGDTNRDERVDVSDVVALLAHLFAGAAPPSCPDAADSNDDGRLSIADPIRTLGFLFQGGAALPPPYPRAGDDVTADALGCPADVGRDTPFVDEGTFPDPNLEPFPSYAPLTASLEGEAGGDSGGPSGDGGGGGAGPGLAAASSPGSEVFVVSAETFEAIQDLAAGASLLDLEEREDLVPLLRDLASDLPHGSPRAIGAAVVVPVAGDLGCWTVEPALLDGGSFDSDGDRFVRGDADGDGRVDAGDFELMRHCISTWADPLVACAAGCAAAWDVDDDGRVDAADVDALGEFLGGYEDGAVLPAPGPACGPDPTPDALPCGGSPCATAPLSLAASPEVLCGSGTHEVVLTVTDTDGRTSRTAVLVTLCAEGSSGCPERPLALDDGERSTGGDESSSGDLSCRWVATHEVVPNRPESGATQKVYDAGGALRAVGHEPPFAALDASTMCSWKNGPGPLHHLFATRRNANCRTPRSDVEKVKDGHVMVRIGLLCADSSGTVVEPECTAKVLTEGLYRSLVTAATAVGPRCGSAPPRVEARAKDQTVFLANGEKVFCGAALVHNGTELSESSSVSVGFELGLGDQNGAKVKINENISRTVRGETGTDSGIVDASGASKVAVPARLLLRAEGEAQVDGDRRTSARAVVSTEVAGIWGVGVTDCPDAGNLSFISLAGTADAVGGALASARDFFLVTLGRRFP